MFVDSLPYYVYKTVIIIVSSSFQEIYELLAILDFNNERKRMSVSTIITYHHVEGAINIPSGCRLDPRLSHSSRAAPCSFYFCRKLIELLGVACFKQSIALKQKFLRN